MNNWKTQPPVMNGHFYAAQPNHYAVCKPVYNEKNYPEYDPTNVAFVGDHNACFKFLHDNANTSIDFALKHGGWCWIPWTETDFPAFGPMISQSNWQDVEKHFKKCMEHYDATSADIVLEDLQPTSKIDEEQGFLCKYVLRWMTYKGWKVSKLMGGCFASNPKYEPKEEPATT